MTPFGFQLIRGVKDYASASGGVNKLRLLAKVRRLSMLIKGIASGQPLGQREILVIGDNQASWNLVGCKWSLKEDVKGSAVRRSYVFQTAQDCGNHRGVMFRSRATWPVSLPSRRGGSCHTIGGTIQLLVSELMVSSLTAIRSGY